MRKRIINSECGLTLLEILFASAFLVLILVIVSSLFDRNVIIHRKVVGADQRREESRYVMDSIIAELREAQSIDAPAEGSTATSVTFNRPGSDNAKRKGEKVTYSYDSSQKSITRSDDSGSPSVVVMKEVNALSFNRVENSLVEIVLSVPDMKSGNATSEYTIRSRASIRRLVGTYCYMEAPAETEDIVNCVVQKMGGLW